MVEEVDKILDALVSVFVAQKTGRMLLDLFIIEHKGIDSNRCISFPYNKFCGPAKQKERFQNYNDYLLFNSAWNMSGTLLQSRSFWPRIFKLVRVFTSNRRDSYSFLKDMI